MICLVALIHFTFAITNSARLSSWARDEIGIRESPGEILGAMRGRSASLTFAPLSLSSLLAIVLLPERSSFSSSSSLSRSFLFFSRRSAASSSTTSSSPPSCLSLLANRSTFSSARPSRRGSPSPFCCAEHDGRKKWRRYGHSSAISARCRVFDEVRVFFLFLFVPTSNSRVAAIATALEESSRRDSRALSS